MSARLQGLLPGVTEGQTVGTDLVIGCDVCVIGSGAGGAVAAYEFAAAGLSVVVLEEGGYFTRPRFRQREDEAYPYLYQDGGQRSTKDVAITILQGKSVGGGTTVNWTTCFRTPPDVVEHWRTKHALQGFTLADLEPHWAAMEQRLSVAKVPLEIVNGNNRTLYDGCKKLGYDVDTTSRNVLGCAQTGSCGHGCPIDAKQSMLVTRIPDALQAGAALLSRCKVDRIRFEGGRAVAVEASLLDAFGTGATGKSVVVRPGTVVVAGGAINSPALLIRSNAPDRNGRIGRRTFLHPVVGSMGLFDEPVRGFAGAPQSVASHHFAHRGDEVGYFLEVAPIHPMLAATAAPGFGAEHRAKLAQLPHMAAHIAISIDGFHDDVEGGVVSVLPSGAPVVDYPIVERQWRALREGQKTLARIALAAGAKAAFTLHDPPIPINSEADIARIDDAPFGPCRLAVFSAHQMGGCAMSDDPARGVVRSEDLRLHDVDNLYVIDGSVFPTSLGVNPQMSIYGLARLMSQRLASTLKRA